MPASRIALVLASIAGCGLMLRSLLFVPPPLPFALAALVVYVSLVAVGLHRSELGMFADVVTSGPASAHGLALTLDDGPNPETTPRVLAELERFGVTATFFVTGPGARAHPELVRAILERGHGVASLGLGRGLRSRGAVRRELAEALAALEAASAPRPSLHRWTSRGLAPGAAAVVGELGLVLVGGASGRASLGRGSPETQAATVVRELRDGAVVRVALIGASGLPDAAGIDALPAVLAALQRLQLGTVRLETWLTDESDRAPVNEPRSS